mmetsp:Transcript_20961/g.67489  ORF Transcript_20961/g.67489 Transcript_20961/m.67489 type:complete len:273 (+) Transcript_20961:336-1154(+)
MQRSGPLGLGHVHHGQERGAAARGCGEHWHIHCGWQQHRQCCATLLHPARTPIVATGSRATSARASACTRSRTRASASCGRWSVPTRRTEARHRRAPRPLPSCDGWWSAALRCTSVRDTAAGCNELGVRMGGWCDQHHGQCPSLRGCLDTPPQVLHRAAQHLEQHDGALAQSTGGPVTQRDMRHGSLQHQLLSRNLQSSRCRLMLLQCSQCLRQTIRQFPQRWPRHQIHLVPLALQQHRQTHTLQCPHGALLRQRSFDVPEGNRRGAHHQAW